MERHEKIQRRRIKGVPVIPPRGGWSYPTQIHARRRKVTREEAYNFLIKKFPVVCTNITLYGEVRENSADSRAPTRGKRVLQNCNLPFFGPNGGNTKRGGVGAGVARELILVPEIAPLGPPPAASNTRRRRGLAQSIKYGGNLCNCKPRTRAPSWGAQSIFRILIIFLAFWQRSTQH
jgi:hypothetical protein